jgi:hypothetical protein
VRELQRPPEIAGDDLATEMIRVWLAHNELHASMLLGMWEDAKDCEIDERKAWGHLLADLTRHIAHGLRQSHGWAEKSTIAWIRQEFLESLADNMHAVEGRYIDEESSE